MKMGIIGRLLLWLGLFVGIVGGVGLTAGFHFTGIAWLVAIGLAKLTLAASLGLMAIRRTLDSIATQRTKIRVPHSAPPTNAVQTRASRQSRRTRHGDFESSTSPRRSSTLAAARQI
jgi:hypothetical protein